MLRSTVQFHWHNRAPNPYADFADLPRRPAARQAQEDRSGAAQGGRGWRPLHRVARRRDHRRRLGLFLPLLAIVDPCGASFDALPDADFFARVAATLPENWLLRRRKETGGESPVPGRRRPATRPRVRPLLGRDRADRLPALRGLLLPAAGLVHRARLRSLRRRCAGRAQDGQGLLPAATSSAHWLAHPQFAQAVSDFLRREGRR